MTWNWTWARQGLLIHSQNSHTFYNQIYQHICNNIECDCILLVITNKKGSRSFNFLTSDRTSHIRWRTPSNGDHVTMVGLRNETRMMNDLWSDLVVRSEPRVSWQFPAHEGCNISRTHICSITAMITPWVMICGCFTPSLVHPMDVSPQDISSPC